MQQGCVDDAVDGGGGSGAEGHGGDGNEGKPRRPQEHAERIADIEKEILILASGKLRSAQESHGRSSAWTSKKRAIGARSLNTYNNFILK